MVIVAHLGGVGATAGCPRDERHGRFIVYRLHPDVFQTGAITGKAEHLDFGCCRLEIPAAEAGKKGKRDKGKG